jgi:hypothetical protein
MPIAPPPTPDLAGLPTWKAKLPTALWSPQSIISALMRRACYGAIQPAQHPVATGAHQIAPSACNPKAAQAVGALLTVEGPKPSLLTNYPKNS